MEAGRKSLLRVGRALVLLVLTGATTLFSFQYSASQELPTRMKIRLCYRAGATNADLMQQCTGLNVPPVVFDSCMRGGTCFSEPPVDGSPAYPPGYPFCGAPGLPACPSPAPCGYGNTIPCPPYSPSQFCGAPGHPSCNAPQACGQIHTLQCQPIGPVTTGDPFALGRLRPSWRVGLPGPDRTPQNLQDLEALGVRGVEFAALPIPMPQAVDSCRNRSGSPEGFFGCLVEEGFPEEYRIARHCRRANPSDAGAALLCSSGREDLQQGYRQLKTIKRCIDSGRRSQYEVADCLGNQFLGTNERYYLGCVTKNEGDLSKAAICALAKDLNAEQQVALACAVSTGGQPAPFVACTGGQLLKRELTKCWEYGIATEQGCYGPNNEIRKCWDELDSQARVAMGANSEGYKAFAFMKNNVFAPGPNHEFVRHFNNALNDVQHGPGPNNDIVRFGQSLGNTLSSVESSVRDVFGFRP